MSDTDLELLARYARQHAEEAFAELVRRHVNLVHSAALRQVRSPQLAEEVAQCAFLKLARQAGQFAPDTVLAAWLYQVTRREAVDVIRREARRQLREQIATEMNITNATDADWTHIEPLLDEAMCALEESDRTVILLRYFENKSLREVGATLGTSDDAAQKRVSRAIERLREIFVKRGVAAGAAGLVVVISANAVQAAPISLALSITTAALAANLSVAATLGTQTTTVAMKLITLKTIAVALTSAVAAGAVTYFAQQHEADHLRKDNQNLMEKQAQLASERDTALSSAAANKAELERLREDQTELLRLRGEVGLLKRQTADQASRLANLPHTSAQAAPEQSGADREKAAAILRQQTIAKLNYSRNWLLACIHYADKNGGSFPATFDQAANYLNDNEKMETLLATNQFDFLYHGSVSALASPSTTIVFRETDPVQTEGGWVRIYAFADGHSEAHRSEDEDFTTWEQTRLPPPANQP